MFQLSPYPHESVASGMQWLGAGIRVLWTAPWYVWLAVIGMMLFVAFIHSIRVRAEDAADVS